MKTIRPQDLDDVGLLMVGVATLLQRLTSAVDLSSEMMTRAYDGRHLKVEHPDGMHCHICRRLCIPIIGTIAACPVHGVVASCTKCLAGTPAERTGTIEHAVFRGNQHGSRLHIDLHTDDGSVKKMRFDAGSPKRRKTYRQGRRSR